MSAQGTDSQITPAFVQTKQGPTGPISAMGPDCYREVVQPQNNNNIAALLVSRDENEDGWTVVQLPGRLATVTCNGESMYGTPSWSNFAFGGIRFGLLEISSVYDADHDIHVEYTFNPGSGDETYWEDFVANESLSLSGRGTDGNSQRTRGQSLGKSQSERGKGITPGQIQFEQRLQVEQDASGALVLVQRAG